MPQSVLSVPAGSSPPPYLDFTGDGRVTQLDGYAVIFGLGTFAGHNAWPTYQNQTNHFDVNYDGVVSSLDAILIINDLNNFGERLLTVSSPYFIDPSGDNVESGIRLRPVMSG